MGVSLGILGPTSRGAVVPADVKTHVQELVEAGQCAGIIVGLVDADGTAYFAHGKRSREGGIIDENTVFEIGSITKVFTAILLASAVERGSPKADAAVTTCLPPQVNIPSYKGKSISLTDLASQRSGLPRLPTNMQPADPDNPYADYTAERLYQFLNGYSLPREPGSAYEYSNVGAGVLGHALWRAADKPYEQLVIERICKPLGMKDTVITLMPGQSSRLAKGHADGREVKGWTFDALAGAGALRSTAKDMLGFLAANLGLQRTEFLPVLKRCLQDRWETGMPDTQVGWGWHITKGHGTEMIWHNGGTGGYHSFCGFVLDKKLGAVVLTNSSHDIDKIGFHLLEPKVELKPVRKATNVEAAVLETYVGHYELQPGFVFQVTREGDQLFAQLTGQPRFEVFPESETKFFYKVVDAQLTFVKGADGSVSNLILHQFGIDQKAPRKLPPASRPP